MATREEVNGNYLVNEVLLEDRLVEIWPDYQCLYDVRSTDFKNRDMRQQAFEEMAKKLSQTVDWVKSKLSLLGNNYTKAIKQPPSGSACKTPSKLTVWALDKLQFLHPHIATRSTISNLDATPPAPTRTLTAIDNEIDPEGECEEDDEDCFLQKLPTKQRPKSMKKQIQEEELQIMKGIASNLGSQNNNAPIVKKAKIVDDGECDSYGSYLLEALQKLDSDVRHVVQYHVNNILFQAQMGTLGKGQQRFLPQQQQFFPPQQFPTQVQQQFLSPQESQTSPQLWK